VTTPISTNWSQTTINGEPYLVMPAILRVPLNWDPSSNVFVAVAPPGVANASFPALADGPPGVTPTLALPINRTILEYTDPTPDSAAFVETSPGVYQLNDTLHKGPPGADGTTTIDLSAYGTPIATQLLVVDPTATTLVYQYQKVGSRWIPATINPCPGGLVNFTMATVSVPAQNFDWRPRPRGYSVITGTGPNMQTDVVVRWNNETAGNIVGRATSVAGQYPPPQTIVAGPPAGSADTYDRVPAGQAATFYFRTERQSGTDYYTTTAAQSQYDVEVLPI
jgi:hypothetical protein